MKQELLWKKQEKRLIKLIYKKGLLDVSLDELYWEGFKPYSKPNRKSKDGYKFTRYYPEVFFCVTDYWGESDDYGVVDSLMDRLYFDNLIGDIEDYDDGWPKSTFNVKSRLGLIKYLESLPTVNFDNKINKVLKLNYNL